jgi:DNA invertase Pin-like site-specific DNA recombinase
MNTLDGSRFISYFRVSTARQGRSGLGIDAQKQAVAAYLNGRKRLAEFVEVESGRKSDRPMLAQALAACRVHRAVLVIAKLDRLARNVSFVSALTPGWSLSRAISLRQTGLPSIFWQLSRSMRQK